MLVKWMSIGQEPFDDAGQLTRQKDVGGVGPSDQNDQDDQVEEAHFEWLQHVQRRVEQVLHVEPFDVVNEPVHQHVHVLSQYYDLI